MNLPGFIAVRYLFPNRIRTNSKDRKKAFSFILVAISLISLGFLRIQLFSLDEINTILKICSFIFGTVFFFLALHFWLKPTITNWLTWISSIGILISTAALVILLSAFNGIEQMVVELYSDFDSSITIKSKHSKTFNQSFIDTSKIHAISGVINISRAIEEIVILQHENKWVHAKMIGVDDSYIEMAKMDKHLIDGEPVLQDRETPLAIIGAGLLDKLGGYIPESDFAREQVILNAPLRQGKLGPRKKAFNTQIVQISSRMNYNREINYQYILVPLALAKELVNYDEDISSVYVSIDEKGAPEEIKENLENILGPDFTVKTNLEKNEIIFQTSQSERKIVFIILLFIFVLSSFNLIASLIMLFIEKRKDIKILGALGLTQKKVFRIFLYEGLMINAIGVALGLLIGYLIIYCQIHFNIIEMPNAGGEPFPFVATFSDAFFIISTISVLGFLSAYLPSRYLVYKTEKT